ncbi:hypothetical protein B0H63DRAFT_554892 [Podospora didyma]|uniref:AAA+ ATPase domain-containing protein n=1 Tax=Podospora didyma TaxID=330526 RepID=A0AAE0U7L7_9PEZI|nr:hypothetical protein B0H63DRAFT_554892 [Podospora didyma]
MTAAHVHPLSSTILRIRAPWYTGSSPTVDDAAASKQKQASPPVPAIIYKIRCQAETTEGLFLGEPFLSESGPHNAHLRGSKAINNLEVYLERNKNVSFTVYREYECCAAPLPQPARGMVEEPDISSFWKRESITIISNDLSRALGGVARSAPYEPKMQLTVLREYVYSRMGQEWGCVNALTSEGRIEAKYIDYIFVSSPATSHINTEWQNKSELQAFIAMDWLATQHDNVGHISAYIEVQYWVFDGRGQMFWKCRRQNYVCYTNGNKDQDMQVATDARYMVDNATYKQMHANAPGASPLKNSMDETVDAVMDEDEHDLGDKFFMCLPTSIYGFNMQKKEWVDLRLGEWIKCSGTRKRLICLLIDEDTKEFVKAVVTNQLNAEDNTDIIRGKGNGLFILLHGGPRTGKTLTAESVAEIAKKPLYRVTCGDIRAKAEEAEKYLEVVLLLGRTWGCVVLLDEADVFLEQRTINNMEGSALVSVFLRVLEYYDVPNTAQPSDQNLDGAQRKKIWKNFIDRLDKLHDKLRFTVAINLGVNIKEICDKLDILAQPNLNGREIRNAISTAR